MTNAARINDTRLADLNKALASLGKESVNIAKPKLALTVAQAAKDRIITEADAKSTFDQYLAAQAKATSANKLAIASGDNPDSYKSNLSKHRMCIRCGALPGIDGVAPLDRAIELRAQLSAGGQKVKSTYQAIADTASAQCRQPGALLTDDEITEIVRKVDKEEGEDSIINDLMNAYKSLGKRLDRAQTDAPSVVPMVQTALDSIGQAIMSLDGELPPITKKDKELASFVTKAKKMGITVTHQPAVPATPAN